jgi:L-fuculose-phosphate aldolase
MGKARELAAASNRLAGLGFVASHGGNLSLRAEDDIILLTPTGRSKAEVEPQDIVIMNLAGEVLSAGKGVEPSSEAPVHLRILRLRPDIMGLIHAHPPVLTGFALAGIDILSKPIHPELTLEVGPLVCLPYAEPTSETLARQFDAVVRQANAFLMGNHGVMIGSPAGVGRALDLLQMLESMAFSAWVATTLGKVRELPAAEIDKLDKILRTRNLPMPGSPEASGSLRALYKTTHRKN